MLNFESAIKEKDNTGYSQYENSSVSKKCEGVKSTHLDRIWTRFKTLMEKHLEKNDCPVDLCIEMLQQGKEAMVIKERSLTHEKVWEHYQISYDKFVQCE